MKGKPLTKARQRELREQVLLDSMAKLGWRRPRAAYRWFVINTATCRGMTGSVMQPSLAWEAIREAHVQLDAGEKTTSVVRTPLTWWERFEAHGDIIEFDVKSDRGGELEIELRFPALIRKGEVHLVEMAPIPLTSQ